MSLGGWLKAKSDSETASRHNTPNHFNYYRALGPPQSDTHSHLTPQDAIPWPSLTRRRSGQHNSLSANSATYLALCWLLGIISSWCPPMAADPISRVSAHVAFMTWWSASLTSWSQPCLNRKQCLFCLVSLPRAREGPLQHDQGASRRHPGGI